MAYDGKIMRRALQRYEEDKRQREALFRQRETLLYAREPRLREISVELRGTMSHIITSALQKGTDPRPAIAALRDRNLSLQRERAELLQKMGAEPDALDEKPNCKKCGDTGYRGGVLCSCLREYYAQEQKKELSALLDLGSQSFDTFSLDWYSDRVSPEAGVAPRDNMEMNYEVCANYAHSFGKNTENLLMTGAPGLGKTFLSAAIAREVSDGGFSVVYDTAAHVFSRFEARKFGRDEQAEEDCSRILRCDLLILDDLGTEMTTAFVVSALYEILNTRLITSRATILNTNLMPETLGSRYSPQIASRIEGEYRILPFFGEDIRRLKREQNG
jgi:DNA replication protein DnaC